MKVIPRLGVSYSNENKLGRLWHKTVTPRAVLCSLKTAKSATPIPSPPEIQQQQQQQQEQQQQQQQQKESILILGCRLRLGRVIISSKNGLAVSEDIQRNHVVRYRSRQCALSPHRIPLQTPKPRNKHINVKAMPCLYRIEFVMQ